MASETLGQDPDAAVGKQSPLQPAAPDATSASWPAAYFWP